MHLIRHQYWQGESFSTVLLGSALEFFKSSLKNLPDQLRLIAEQLPSLRDEFRRRLTNHVHLLCQGCLDDEVMGQALICIDSLTSCEDLLLASSDMDTCKCSIAIFLIYQLISCTVRADCQQISAGLFAKMSAGDEKSPSKSNLDRWLRIIQDAQHQLQEPDHLPLIITHLEAGKAGDGRSSSVGLWKTPGDTIREQRSQIYTALNAAEMLYTNKRLELLSSFSLSGQDADRDQLLLLQALISPKATSPLQIPEESSVSLSGIVNATYNYLQQRQTFQTSVLLWQTMNILLRSYVRV